MYKPSDQYCAWKIILNVCEMQNGMMMRMVCVRQGTIHASAWLHKYVFLLFQNWIWCLPFKLPNWSVHVRNLVSDSS
jgi:hypothetical protein